MAQKRRSCRTSSIAARITQRSRSDNLEIANSAIAVENFDVRRVLIAAAAVDCAETDRKRRRWISALENSSRGEDLVASANKREDAKEDLEIPISAFV
ncbi:hypothetical protein L596_005492 [Steinernema carpocapsae]|uniref:Uncharacterized protein n=1 Tax=Steinernema carpocapsae TaxID=34508 RepID=A0A4U8UZ63_STECR|nr:hypothetical protein L596_005492 [Steinernema carpocapsae]